MAKLADFIHLRVHSSYSLSEGAIMPSKLIGLCHQERMPAVAVTDTGNLFGSLEFSKAALSDGIQPIIGVQVAVAGEKKQGGFEAAHKVAESLPSLVLLAKNEQGYNNLLKLISRSFLDGPDGVAPHITENWLFELGDGLIVLSGGADGPIGKALQDKQTKEARAVAEKYKARFGDCFYIELQRHGMQEEALTEPGFLELAYDLDIPLVATNNVFFATRDMYEAHDALLCIAEGRFVAEENRRRLNKNFYFRNAAEMKEIFRDIPEAIENTVVIAKRCAVCSPSRDPILPHFDCGEGRDESDELRIQSEEGLERRLQSYVYTDEMDETKRKEVRKEYFDRLAFELDVIINMQFPGYFLIVSDFIKWSKRNNVPVGPGRGSGAGSIVAWSLEITDLDPLRFGLLFERFLNPERVSMPDFDIDFCQEKRDRVIRYVQEKYGRDRVAQIITFGKLQARAVLRDVGRVLQLPYNQVDRISKMIPFNPLDPVTLSKALEMDKDLQAARDDDPDVKHLIDICLQLEGLNRHASTHAAGVVIADRPLQELIPVYRDPRSDMPVTQYSMKYAESAGLVKFDFLGLKTLTVIAKAIELISNKGIEVDISQIPMEDKKTFEMLSKGDSVGVFQLESAGMRDTLRKLKPDNIEDIIALISLYRPGPMDNIPSYIARKHGTEEPDYLHPMLETVLKETYGVIIYQEQVMQIAQIMGGYSLGGAD